MIHCHGIGGLTGFELPTSSEDTTRETVEIRNGVPEDLRNFARVARDRKVGGAVRSGMLPHQAETLNTHYEVRYTCDKVRPPELRATCRTSS